MNISIILVTGGAGFIGSSLCEYLIANGFTVVCLDNFDKFYSPQTKKDNIMHLLGERQFYLEEGDVGDKRFLENVFSRYSIDAVIHLANIAGVRNSISNINTYFQVNVNKSITLFETMKTSKVNNLIFASSSSVYGNNNRIQKEKNCSDFQVSPYATTKKTLELLTYNYHINFEFNVLNLRLFSVYGAKQRPDLFIHRAFEAIYTGQELEIYGDGQQQRDFTHITDVLIAFHNAINVIQRKESIYEIINIGNGTPISINALIKIIEKIANQKLRIRYVSQKKGDVQLTYADISKAKKVLQFCPEKRLAEGINEFNNWYKAQKDGRTIKTNHSN